MSTSRDMIELARQHQARIEVTGTITFPDETHLKHFVRTALASSPVAPSEPKRGVWGQSLDYPEYRVASGQAEAPVAAEPGDADEIQQWAPFARRILALASGQAEAPAPDTRSPAVERAWKRFNEVVEAPVAAEPEALTPPGVKPYRTLDELKTDEDLRLYVQAYVAEALAQPEALTRDEIENVVREMGFTSLDPYKFARAIERAVWAKIKQEPA